MKHTGGHGFGHSGSKIEKGVVEMHTQSQHHKSAIFAIHRVEAFSDAVFAFAVTLLVVSLEVPKSAHDLFHIMHGFVAFGICFFFLVAVWVDHAKYFSHFAVNDNVTLLLSMLLLFIVLLYVYPMKFLFSILIDELIWNEGDNQVQNPGELRTLLRIYGGGFLALALTFLAMYWRSLKHRTRLALDHASIERVKGAVRRHAINGLAALELIP
jgi:uncharacterized membrane protein